MSNMHIPPVNGINIPEDIAEKMQEVSAWLNGRPGTYFCLMCAPDETNVKPSTTHKSRIASLEHDFKTLRLDVENLKRTGLAAQLQMQGNHDIANGRRTTVPEYSISEWDKAQTRIAELEAGNTALQSNLTSSRMTVQEFFDENDKMRGVLKEFVRRWDTQQGIYADTVAKARALMDESDTEGTDK